MTDEIALSQERARGARAQALLEDQMLNEAFEELERAYIEAWKNNTDSDGRPVTLGPEGRESLWRAIQVLGKVKNHLITVVSRGKLAAAELDALHPNSMR